MLKKRLIGVVVVRHGLAVQSFGYRRYLPLGRPEVLVDNLDRWGVDEILVQSIDRSAAGFGPDLDLLERLGGLGLATPLIYAGGLRNASDAVRVVNLGADRVMVDAMLWDAPPGLEALSRELGAQALIANLPVRLEHGRLVWRNYRDGRERLVDRKLLAQLPLNWASEIMLTDWRHEGTADGFDEGLFTGFPLADKPLVVFGGLSEPAQIQRVLSRENVVAAGVGNFLNYTEHAVQRIKRSLDGIPMRSACYAGSSFS